MDELDATSEEEEEEEGEAEGETEGDEMEDEMTDVWWKTLPVLFSAAPRSCRRAQQPLKHRKNKNVWPKCLTNTFHPFFVWF